MAGSFSRPYFRTNASKLHSGPRWPSSTSFTSYGVAFRVRASAITWSVGTYMNSASLSTNFSMSHGHATRSTRGCSRVIHFTRELPRVLELPPGRPEWLGRRDAESGGRPDHIEV